MSVQTQSSWGRRPGIDYAAPFFPVLLAPIAFLLYQYAAMDAAWAERYSQLFTQFIASPVSSVLGYFPFSISEMAIGLAIVGFVFTMLAHLLRGNWLRLVALPLALASILYAMFAAGWGIAYLRQPYADKAGLSVQPASVEQLERLCLSLVEQANSLREGADEDENGIYAPSGSHVQLLSRVQGVYDAASHKYRWLAGRFGNPKPVALSEGMSYLQISGIFIPHTMEANVNMNSLGFMIPATALHEAAHLRGWAREDEANYIAYAVAMQSGDDDFMYSGTVLGLIHAGNALAGADSERYWAMQALYGEGLQRDLAAHSAHWAKYDGQIAELQERVNDAYLRVNRQEDGVRSYGRMVDLMLAAMAQEEA